MISRHLQNTYILVTYHLIMYSISPSNRLLTELSFLIFHRANNWLSVFLNKSICWIRIELLLLTRCTILLRFIEKISHFNTSNCLTHFLSQKWQPVYRSSIHLQTESRKSFKNSSSKNCSKVQELFSPTSISMVSKSEYKLLHEYNLQEIICSADLNYIHVPIEIFILTIWTSFQEKLGVCGIFSKHLLGDYRQWSVVVVHVTSAR